MPTHRELNRSILRLAVPAILTNIATPLMAMVDISVVGHFGDAAYISAIAVGGAIFNMMYWLLNFLRTGTSGLTAQAYGRHDKVMMADVLVRALAIACSASALIVLFSLPVREGMIAFLSPEADAADYARTYFDAAIWGAPGVLLTYALSGWFVGNQDTRPILAMAVSSNLLNIALNFTFVYAFDLDITGVGAATAISQWVSAAIGVMFVMRLKRQRGLIFKMRCLRAWDGQFKVFFKINVDIFLRTLCLVAVTLWFTRAGARLGDVTLAMNAVMMQLFMLFSFFMDGFAFAGEALAGRFYGAGDKPALKAAIAILMRWGFGLAVLTSLVYLGAGQWIFALLTDSSDVLAMSADYRAWIIAVPVCSFMAFTWDGVFIGMTKTRLMLLSMFVAMVVFFALYYLTSGWLGNHAVWLAFTAYLATRGLAQWMMFRV